MRIRIQIGYVPLILIIILCGLLCCDSKAVRRIESTSSFNNFSPISGGKGEDQIFEYILYLYDDKGYAFQTHVWRGSCTLGDYFVKFHNGFCNDCETYVSYRSIIFEVPVPRNSKLGYGYKVAGNYGKTVQSTEAPVNKNIFDEQ